MKNILIIFVSTTLVLQIVAHSYLTFPTSRGKQDQTHGGCVMPTCTGPCEQPASAAGAGYATSRGATIQLHWPRNNHPAGFVRFAWAPTANSDSMTAFDTGIDQFRCFEAPGDLCKPGNPNAPNDGDGPDQTQTSCGATITVPGWVTDGKWTLQWAWFGGGYALGDYYGCVDYAVSGGTASAKQNPIFYGGDYTNTAANQCKFFNTNKIHFCIKDGCPSSTNPYAQNGVPDSAVIGVTGTPQSTGVVVGTSTSSGGVSGGVSGSVSGSLSGTSGTTGNDSDIVACISDTQCASGICQSDGYCYNKKGSHLDGGGIAAIVFAMFFVVVVALIVVFVIVNKSEWSNWKPFNKGSGGGGYGFKGSVNPTNN